MIPEPTRAEREAPEPANNIIANAMDVVSSYLLDNGWKKDARCKKWETYKKEINGEMYQVKCKPRTLTFDKGVKRNTWDGLRTNWETVNEARYDYFDDFTKVIQFLNRLPVHSDFVPTQEDKENETYLNRLGIAV